MSETFGLQIEKGVKSGRTAPDSSALALEVLAEGLY
jgi:hypothetical protein